MKALVLESVGKISIRDYPIKETLGADDVRIQIKSCGICGSDIHYYKHGSIGDFIVKEPMILGHEASGIITEVGSNVSSLRVGDRVCMEPGIPDLKSEEAISGNYNIDPSVRFWATPPIHGCLRESVVHPAMFTYKLLPELSFEEGSMIEPLAIGMEAVKRAEVQPGDIALVNGAGTIGMMTAISALASGCSKVFISDVKQKKLDIAATYENLIPINAKQNNLIDAIMEMTGGRGVERLFECSGYDGCYPDIFRCCAPGAYAVLVGMPIGAVPFDISFLQARGITIKTIFRYVNEYRKTIAQVAAGKVNLKPLISKVFPFSKAIEAYEYASAGYEDVVKVIINI